MKRHVTHAKRAFLSVRNLIPCFRPIVVLWQCACNCLISGQTWWLRRCFCYNRASSAFSDAYRIISWACWAIRSQPCGYHANQRLVTNHWEYWGSVYIVVTNYDTLRTHLKPTMIAIRKWLEGAETAEEELQASSTVEKGFTMLHDENIGIVCDLWFSSSDLGNIDMFWPLVEFRACIGKARARLVLVKLK